MLKKLSSRNNLFNVRSVLKMAGHAGFNATIIVNSWVFDFDEKLSQKPEKKSMTNKK